MHIGINALFQAGGGSLTHLIHLLREWGHAGVIRSHRVTLFASRTSHERLADELPAGVRTVVIERADRGLFARTLIEQRELPRLAAERGIDVLYCPGNTMPLRTPIPCVLSFQNAAPFSPEAMRTVGWGQRLKWAVLGQLMKLGGRRAARVVFISEYFRDLFRRRVPMDPGRCVVIHRARQRESTVSADPQLERFYCVPRPYLLTVSHVYPYKNLIEVVDAFAALRERTGRRELALVIAGRTDLFPRYAARLRARIAELGLGGSVHCIGSVEPAHVRPLIAGSEAFVFSSTCENCPTGLIEAIEVGVPIACSNVGVMPEVGGDAVAYYDPYSPAGLADVLTALTTDAARRAELVARCRRRVTAFPTHAESAGRILAVLEDAAGDVTKRRAA
jgi:glycosyltransferase involved in cell wall biosynthesis